MTNKPDLHKPTMNEPHRFVPRAYATVPWNMICRHCDGFDNDPIHEIADDGLIGATGTPDKVDA